MKLTQEIVQRALAQHDKLVDLGVKKTAGWDMYSKDGSVPRQIDGWKNVDAYLL